ncbi:MAG: LysR family transcriptional regulator [Rhodospirillaceae bacterium]
MDSIHNFRHLQVVSAVARHGGVRRAALRINLSQPAISQAVSKLERAIGERLFDRSARGMVPTQACQRFAQRIERAIGYLKSGAQDIAGRKADAPLLDRLATTVQLRALVEVIEHGGYAPAARRLGVTQPNMSRAINDLEKVAGCELFQPSPFGAAPTRDALVLARWANLAFREIEQGLDELREQKGARDGSIVIGSLPLARTFILPTAVTRLLAQHPDARVEIIDGSYTELLNRLQHGRIDLILGALRLPALSNDLRQEELFREPLSIVVRAGHPALKGRVLNPAKLAKLEWVVPNERTPARAHFTAFFRAHGLQVPRRIIECSSLIATRGLLVQSDRAALLSAGQIHYEALAGELAIAAMALPGTERPIGICTRRDWQPTKIQTAFMSFIHEVVNERPPTSKSQSR